MASKKQEIEEEFGRQLTNRQMTFAQKIVEGIYSNAECARLAGYAQDLAGKQASVLLNGQRLPACCGIHPRVTTGTRAAVWCVHHRSA